MKKLTHILAVAVLCTTLISGVAYASRARTLVLSSGNPLELQRGSLFYDDQNNLFYNPSYANDFHNWVTLEKSNFPGNSAEGGFVSQFFTFNLGFYMNRGDAIATQDNTHYVNQNDMRPFDVILAGDSGVKWGLLVTSGGYKASPTASQSDLVARAGIQASDFAPYVAYKIRGKETSAAAPYTDKMMQVGIRYKWGEWNPYAQWTNRKGTTQENEMGLGLGRNTLLSQGTHLAYAIGFWRNSKLGRNVLPIDVNLESELATWFTARAGVHYALYDQTSGTTNADNTTARLGGSFKFGKSELDFAFGRSSSTSAGAEVSSSADSQTLGVGNSMFTAASFTHRW